MRKLSVSISAYMLVKPDIRLYAAKKKRNNGKKIDGLTLSLNLLDVILFVWLAAK